MKSRNVWTWRLAYAALNLPLAMSLAGCGDKPASAPQRQAGAATGTPTQAAATPTPPSQPSVDAGVPSPTEPPPRVTPPWKSTMPGTIRVLSTGTGAKAVLQYDIAPGTKQTSVLEVQMDLGQGGPTSPRPTIVMEFDTTAGEPAVGGESLAVTFTKFYAKEREHSVIPAAMATEQISKLNGLTLTGHLTANGFLRGVKVVYPDAISDEAIGTTQGMLRSVEKVLPQLPVVPVGVGAKWEIHETMQQDGIDVKSTTLVQLTAKRGTKITLKSTTTMLAPPQIMKRGGETVQVQGIDGKGAMTVELDLGKSMPSVEQTLDMNIDLGVQFTSKMKLTLTSR